ncbi:hypothetical protein KUTeg_011262 [Tegillarca granosa]|uniref:Flavodoxin-like domain-containing protein n=1 Tax=Tegillarca granosa TaxID=220873 RepID=A0ABQ9F4P4_TEGGR|nr:hypothetical protein KUTeg_011262 [Tegillarca granosa]
MPGEQKNSFLLLYGSQTGQAKAIAEEIAEKAETQHNLKANVYCLSQTEKKFNIEKEKCVVIVTSTTGDGEPPDTAAKFFRRLNKKTLQEDYLSNINYTLLGLGDSNYTNFCKCGKAVDKRLEELGAKRFYPSGFADDAVGLEVVVEPWMDGLFPVLQRFLGLTPHDSESSLANMDNKCLNGHVKSNSTSDDLKNTDSVITNDSINISDVINTNEINSSQLKQEISKVDQNLAKSNGEINKTYKSYSEAMTNGSDKSIDLIDADKVPLSVESHKQEASLGTSIPPLSESSLNLPALPPAFLHIEFLPEESLNGLAFPSAATAVTMATVISAKQLTREDAVKRTLCLCLDIKNSDIKYLPGDAVSVVCTNSEDEVNHLFKRLDISHVADQVCKFDILPDTKKRNPSALIRSLVEFTTNQSEKRRLQELCSKQGADHYSKFIRESRISLLDLLLTFPSCNPPVERILEHLPRLQPRPYSVCRSEIEGFEESGILSKLCVSFSRDEQQDDLPRYVQDNLLLHSSEVMTLLESDAIVYVCGDAKNMAKDVNEAFLQIIQKEREYTEEEAKRYVMKMRLYKKYMEDVWT